MGFCKKDAHQCRTPFPGPDHYPKLKFLFFFSHSPLTFAADFIGHVSFTARKKVIISKNHFWYAK